MKKKLIGLASILCLITITAGLSVASPDNASPMSIVCPSGVIDKRPLQSFDIQITFKNIGTSAGAWSINVAFEGDEWTWTGTPRTVILDGFQRRTLTWSGKVPVDASIGSVSRLVVYYNNSFMPLEWWIHIIPGAELSITSSTVT